MFDIHLRAKIASQQLATLLRNRTIMEAVATSVAAQSDTHAEAVLPFVKKWQADDPIAEAVALTDKLLAELKRTEKLAMIGPGKSKGDECLL